MNTKQALKSKLMHPIRKVMLVGNYWLGNYKQVIWLIGDARSGTTWVSNLINYDKKYREMFEPFHPHHIDEMGSMPPHLYMRAQDNNVQLESFAADVFSGKFTNPWTDSGNRSLIYNGLLIKDVWANLFSYWVSLRFSDIKIVFLIRNPFSVALSKYKTKNWRWVVTPSDLLNQNGLYEDYLRPFEDVIRRTSIENDYILCQILIWAIINYIPLCQFKAGQVHIVFYENILANPNHEISQIFRFLNPENSTNLVQIDNDIISRVSRASKKSSNILSGKATLSAWKNELSLQQIDAGLEILKRFGFEELYDQESMPNRDVLRRIHEKP
jgi:Sulfotransferase domain